MAAHAESGESQDTTEQFKHYLPAAARTSSEPGRAEQFLTALFRRRGDTPLLIRR